MFQKSDSKVQRSRSSNRIWIRDILESEINPDTNEISTRYGVLYRTHIVGTILDMKIMKKKEKEENSDSDDDVENVENWDGPPNIKMFIDDGTGVVEVVLWNTNPESIPSIKKGAYVHIVGPVRLYEDKKKNRMMTKTILVEVIEEETNPNYEIYHDLKVIEKRVKIPRHEIKKIERGMKIKEDDPANGTTSKEDLIEYNNSADELNAIDQMAREEVVPFARMREKKLSVLENKIIELIKSNDDGNGVATKIIAQNLGKSEKEILQNLEKLSQKNFVYSSNPGFWSLN